MRADVSADTTTSLRLRLLSSLSSAVSLMSKLSVDAWLGILVVAQRSAGESGKIPLTVILNVFLSRVGEKVSCATEEVKKPRPTNKIAKSLYHTISL